MAKEDQGVDRRGRGSITTSTQVSYQGLLPPPSMLEHYARILPGGVDWILKTVETQIAHRQALETKKIDSDIKNEGRGQVFAFIITMTVVLVGGVLIFTGRSTTGGITLIVGALVSLAGVFIYGRSRLGKELEVRRRRMQEIEGQSHR